MLLTTVIVVEIIIIMVVILIKKTDDDNDDNENGNNDDNDDHDYNTHGPQTSAVQPSSQSIDKKEKKVLGVHLCGALSLHAAQLFNARHR